MDGMNHFSYGTPEPTVKFEPSPAESVMSTPSGEYPSLFANSPMPSTMNPRDIMTPESTHDDDFHNDNASQSANDRSGVSQTPEPGQGEKKQTKKRKSWGQVLPEPKTNLPPRKRAKTEDEKEQRRVERVLRNRRAAQSSRERKRQEVEALEKTNQELRDQLAQANRIIQQLVQKVGETPSSTTLDALRPNPLTFSQELFNSQDGHMAPQPSSTASSLMDGILMNSQSSNTVNPASLSPSLLPVPEQDEDDWLAQNESSNTAPLAPVVPRTAQAATEETSPDATQLPAAKLCSSDLQSSALSLPDALLDSSVFDNLGVSAATPTGGYVDESGLLSSPDASHFEYDHLAGDDAAASFFSGGNSQYDHFDITEFLTDDITPLPNQAQQPNNGLDSRGAGLAGGHQLSLPGLATQDSSTDPFLQPPSGASLEGCDVGGIAIGSL
ncbi:basic region leucine zipper [Coniochaeta sp. 2T2.1]|nr:basic region leucine zipper [Coniochaeta sp. 2T2.1]